MLRQLCRFCATVLGGFVLGTFAGATEAPSELDLRYAVVVTRHGIRSPLPAQTEALERFAAAPWPKWSVPPGELTPHGRRQMKLVGQYYRERFVHEGLLTGNPEQDVRLIHFRSDSDERTIATTRGLAAAMIPGQTIDPHARAGEKPDPLFRPAQIPIGPIDRQLGIASVLGRMGGNADNVVFANRRAFSVLQQVLVGESGVVPSGKSAVLDVPTQLTPGTRDHTVNFSGPLQIGESAVDVLLLEYSEGLPLDQVGWGRVTPERLTELSTLHSLFFELAQGSHYPARVQASNLASHILASLEQAATGEPNPHAFGGPGQKLVVVVGHDTNIATLGGLLGLTWWLPGAQRDPLLPGGALVFELRERRSDHALFVCIAYVAPTLQQTRDLTPLTLQNPPAQSPIFIPGASEARAHYAAPLPQFTALARRVIDPAFVVADPN
jgi:4-phytase/acid phosphatase